jgi:hypothetical protein
MIWFGWAVQPKSQEPAHFVADLMIELFWWWGSFVTMAKTTAGSLRFTFFSYSSISFFFSTQTRVIPDPLPPLALLSSFLTPDWMKDPVCERDRMWVWSELESCTRKKKQLLLLSFATAAASAFLHDRSFFFLLAYTFCRTHCAHKEPPAAKNSSLLYTQNPFLSHAACLLVFGSKPMSFYCKRLPFCCEWHVSLLSDSICGSEGRNLLMFEVTAGEERVAIASNSWCQQTARNLIFWCISR